MVKLNRLQLTTLDQVRNYGESDKFRRNRNGCVDISGVTDGGQRREAPPWHDECKNRATTELTLRF